MNIELPPLKSRLEDIPLLCDYFINRYNKKLRKNILKISSAGLSKLFNYNWPGNIRELENIIERAVLLTEDHILQPDDLYIQSALRRKDDFKDDGLGFSLKEAKKKLEKQMITKALEKTGGNRTQSSKLLEISHPSLLAKIKLYKI